MATDRAMADERDPSGPAASALARLRTLCGTGAKPLGSWSDEDLLLLPRLYRAAASELARLEGAGAPPERVADARRWVLAAHARLYAGRAEREGPAARLVRFLAADCPRAIRAEWGLLAASALVFYGLAALAWVLVGRDLDLAPSLLDARVVEQEVEALRALEPGERFRGNFDFGIGESPGTAGLIMANNVRVSALFFASSLVPPLYLWILAANALMLGTYTAVAGHWGEAGSISGFLWCHGVLEIQAILLAGAAGLVLVRAWIRPGARTRGRALAQDARRALALFAPVAPILFAAGLIEGFVTPHAPLAARLAVAVGSGLLLAAYVLLGGRERGGRGAAAEELSGSAPPATR